MKRLIKHSTRHSTKRTVALTLATGVMFTAGFAFARPGHGGCGKAYGMHRIPGVRCSRMLMHASPDRLKAKLGLTDQQLAKIEPVRTNFLRKRIRFKADLKQQRLDLRRLMWQEAPSEGKVLALMRKSRGVRGRLAEERVKAHLKVLSILTPDQRKKVRARCGGPGGGGFGDGPCPHCAKKWGGKRGRGHGGPPWGPGPHGEGL